MWYRIEEEQGKAYVVQNSDDVCIACSELHKYVGEICSRLNKGSAFDGDFPYWFTVLGPVELKEDRNVVQQKP